MTNLICDEANQTSLELLLGTCHERSFQDIEHLFMCGDIQQLAPVSHAQTITSDSSELLSVTSIYEQMLGHIERQTIANRRRQLYYTQLNVQRRCHPQISRIWSRAFYGNRVRDGSMMQNIRSWSWIKNKNGNIYKLKHLFFHGDHQHTQWHVINKCSANAYESPQKSKVCKQAVERCMDYLRTCQLLGIEAKHIAIISEYSAMVKEIRKQLITKRIAYNSDENESGNGNGNQYDLNRLLIGSVNVIEGSSRPLVIYLIGRSNHSGNIGFCNDFRRINVALSRAQFAQIIIGDIHTLQYNRYYRQIFQMHQALGYAIYGRLLHHSNIKKKNNKTYRNMSQNGLFLVSKAMPLIGGIQNSGSSSNNNSNNNALGGNGNNRRLCKLEAQFECEICQSHVSAWTFRGKKVMQLQKEVYFCRSCLNVYYQRLIEFNNSPTLHEMDRKYLVPYHILSPRATNSSAITHSKNNNNNNINYARNSSDKNSNSNSNNNAHHIYKRYKNSNSKPRPALTPPTPTQTDRISLSFDIVMHQILSEMGFLTPQKMKIQDQRREYLYVIERLVDYIRNENENRYMPVNIQIPQCFLQAYHLLQSSYNNPSVVTLIHQLAQDRTSFLNKCIGILNCKRKHVLADEKYLIPFGKIKRVVERETAMNGDLNMFYNSNAHFLTFFEHESLVKYPPCKVMEAMLNICSLSRYQSAQLLAAVCDQMIAKNEMQRSLSLSLNNRNRNRNRNRNSNSNSKKNNNCSQLNKSDMNEILRYCNMGYFQQSRLINRWPFSSNGYRPRPPLTVYNILQMIERAVLKEEQSPFYDHWTHQNSIKAELDYGREILLNKYQLPYWSETQLQDAGYKETPDYVLRKPLLFWNSVTCEYCTVHWIDFKNFYLSCSKTRYSHLRAQARKYNRRFGGGVFLFGLGFCEFDIMNDISLDMKGMLGCLLLSTNAFEQILS
jgi:hypothetical protein